MPTDPSASHLNIDDAQATSVSPFTYGELYRHRNEEVKEKDTADGSELGDPF